MLNAIDSEITVRKMIGSVEETIEYSRKSPIWTSFLDIQSPDGVSFEIFSETEIDYPSSSLHLTTNMPLKPSRKTVLTIC
jgi:hypothetical protein